MKKTELMKSILSFIILAILIPTSCTKDSGRIAVIVRDCSGTYLKMDGKDYYVCNAGKISSFPAGATISVSFKPTDACLSVSPPACFMFHQNEGWIEVTRVK